MTRDEFVASGLKSIDHNPDHPDSKLLEDSPAWLRHIAMSISVDSSMVIMSHQTFTMLRRPQLDFFCVPTPLWYS